MNAQTEIKIIAIDLDNGWEFISKDGKTFLLRPPYTSSNQIEVSREFVENAIHLQGFEECDIPIVDINEAIEYLKEKYIESKRDQDIGLPSSEQLIELLEYADDIVLFEYLNRIKRDLIPEGKLDTAGFIVSELAKLEQVKSNPEMWRMVMEIIEGIERAVKNGA